MTDYKETLGINQSTLKKILISPKSYLSAVNKQENQIESEEEHFVFGTIIDIMLTGTREDFNKRFVKVPDNIKGSPNIILMLKSIREELNKLSSEEAALKSLEDFKSSIIKWARNNNYQPKWGDDALIKNLIVNDTKETFEILKTTVGKITVKESEYINAVGCKSVLELDRYTKFYVDKKLNNNKEVEFLDKFIINFTFKDLLFKGEIDRIVINHTTKEIIPIDFKFTGKSINDFEYDFWKYRYDFQATVYTHGLFENIKIQELIKEGYKLNNFLYIVVEKSLFNNPIIFKVTDEVRKIGREGGTLSNGKKLEGFIQAIDRYKFHTEINKWDYPMEYYKNEGFLNLQV